MSAGPWVWRDGYGVVSKAEAAKIDAERKPKPVHFDFKRIRGRGSFVLRYNAKGKAILVPRDKAAPLKRETGPGVISDYIKEGHVQHMATGKWHDAKSTFRRDTKASGCVELGNDAPRTPKKPEPRERMGYAIKRTIEQLQSR